MKMVIHKVVDHIQMAYYTGWLDQLKTAEQPKLKNIKITVADNMTIKEIYIRYVQVLKKKH